MNIAMLLDYFPDITETFILDQISGLLHHGHDIRIFYLTRTHPALLQPEVRRHRLFEKAIHIDDPSSINLKNFMGTDLIQAHFGTVARKFIHLKQKLDIPFVTYFHGCDVMPVLKKNRNAYNRVFSASNIMLVPSEFLKSRLVEYGGAPPGKIHVHRYGVNPELFKPAGETHAERLKILTVARCVEKKGLEYALWSVAKLSDRYTSVRYEIIGDGYMMPFLKDLSRFLGIDRIVRFRGEMTQNSVRNAMRRSDIFLLPSVTAENGDTEGLPVSILEAQASGLPVVSTRHAGIPEAVKNGRSGFLVREREVDDLAAALKRLMHSPALRNRFARAGRSNILKHHDRGKLTRRLAEVYRNLVNKHASGKTGHKHNDCRNKRIPLNNNGFLTSIIILTRNHLDYTRKCLRSLKKYTHTPYELIIIDNCSTDGTREYLRSLDNARVIRNSHNMPFARACNTAIRSALGKYILLLNNDVILTDGWLGKIQACISKNRNTGIAVPCTNAGACAQNVLPPAYRNDAELQRYAKIFESDSPGSSRKTEWATGFCMLIKRKLIERIGLLDERFGWGGYEDYDYCVRAKRSGYDIRIANDTYVHHFGKLSSRNSQYRKLRRRNRQAFMHKWRAIARFFPEGI